jgi:hypothetical protein
MNTKEKAEIWKEYFDKLLNKEEPKELVQIGNREINEVEELTIEDVRMAMRNLKNNTAAGSDGIHPEIIKYRGNKLFNRNYELLRQILEEESIPDEWKETIIVLIYEKTR